MTIGRPPIAFALLDLPSDHEIDGRIVTECEVINAILQNRDLGSQVRHFRMSTATSFDQMKSKEYPNINCVHLAAHGHRKHVAFIGGRMPWKQVAIRLRYLCPPLKYGAQRVLCLSCCHSAQAFNELKPRLKGHFTGIYFFRKEKIAFATAMTVWSMFYNRKGVAGSGQEAVDPINTFFEKKVLLYKTV